MVDTPSNIHEYTVSELSGALKRTVEDRFGHVRVRAELSGVKRHSSGHLYLSLKDENAAIDGVCWRGNVSRLRFLPEDGLEVIVTGKLSTYPARSKYQIVIEHMEPAGAGALMALLEERKKKLAAEGLFAVERKKPLPFLPHCIAVVTSPTGAVIRDILHRLNDRFPRHVLVWPVAVQGEGAAEQVANAISGFNRLARAGVIEKPDIMIVARGGGSIEDLWAFNEEVVVRAVADSEIPIISAVGHETDTTLIDYVSDRRAPTPTAAAEMAVPVKADLDARLADFASRMRGAKRRYFDFLADRLTGLARGLPRPRDILGNARQRLDDVSDRLPRGLRHVARERQSELARLEGILSPARLRQLITYKKRDGVDLFRRLDPAQKAIVANTRRDLSANIRLLETLSYQAVLRRGYAVLRSEEGEVIKSAKALKAGMTIEAILNDGRRTLQVEKSAPKAAVSARAPNDASKSKRKKTSSAPSSSSSQGSLF